MHQIITITTDFGLEDGYVAAMKGVILSIAPDTTLVDISHQIPRHDITAAAFVLASAAPFFPTDAVHLVVVDPGVGSHRRAIAVQTNHDAYVAPDNGVLTWVLRRYAPIRAASLTEKKYWRAGKTSQTFHGRDIFAPVAAHLANGVSVTQLGSPIDDLVSLSTTVPTVMPDGRIIGQIVHVDHFGTLISNIPAEQVTPNSQVAIANRHLPQVMRTYAQVAPGALLALVGSHGFLEIAVREGSAANALQVTRGQPITVQP